MRKIVILLMSILLVGCSVNSQEKKHTCYLANNGDVDMKFVFYTSEDNQLEKVVIKQKQITYESNSMNQDIYEEQMKNISNDESDMIKHDMLIQSKEMNKNAILEIKKAFNVKDNEGIHTKTIAYPKKGYIEYNITINFEKMHRKESLKQFKSEFNKRYNMTINCK